MAEMVTHSDKIQIIQDSAKAKFDYYDSYKAWNALNRASQKGMTYAQLQEMTDGAKSWSKWTNSTSIYY
jgi:hypothetical protein